MAAVPYKNSEKSKKGQVEEMFDNISPKYDLLNHVLSLNIDKVWRKRAIKKLAPLKPKLILDVATGTGDFAINASKLENCKVIGIDISEGMLQVGKEKVSKRGLENRIEFFKADSENLPFDNNYFDAAIVGFGVRNFENLSKGLAEINRVLKPKGSFTVLEFSKPKNFPFKQIYFFYFKNVLPFLGKLVSKDASAYTYLPESVKEFPDGEAFIKELKKVGFVNCEFNPQTFGISTIYRSQKA